MINEINTTAQCDPPQSPNWPALSSSLPQQGTIQETISAKIVHFFYNLTRKENPRDLSEMSLLFSDIFRSLKHSYQRGDLPHTEYLDFVSTLFKMVVQTRDFEMGKGERDLTYMMIYVWYQHYPLMSILLIRLMVGAVDLTDFGSDQKNRCFGSWKDIVGLCQYIMERSSSVGGPGCAMFVGGVDATYDAKKFHPLIETAIEIAIHQLHCDFRALETGDKLSFVAKWIPREKSSAGRLLYDHFVYHWIQKTQPWILQSATDCTRLIYAWNKSRRIFRKVLSRLNRALDTTEIKMCSQNWASISPEKINFLTFVRSRDAFLNLSKRRGVCVDEVVDREVCSQNVKQHFYSNKVFQKVKYKNDVKSNPYDSGIRTFSSSIYPAKTLPFGYSDSLPPSGGGITSSILSVDDSDSDCDADCDEKRRNMPRSKTSKLRNYPLSIYVKRAFELIALSSDGSSPPTPWIQTQIATLNQQWRYNLSFHIDLNFTIPIVDVPILVDHSESSCSLETLYQMIGVACFLAEKSTLDKRMLFLIHHKPVWLNLSNCLDFYSMMKEIYELLPSFSSGESSSLSDYELLSRSSSFSPSSEGVVQAVQMILESVRNINMSKETADKMIWVFLQNWGEYTSSMISQIDQQCSRFHRLHSAFQTTPHIVYWNFHSKTISPFFSLIPVDSVGCGGGDVGSKHQLLKERTTFFSGFSTSFIDYLCFMGNSIFGQSNVRDSTPYQTIRQLFHHPHYAVYEKIFKKIVS